MLLCYKNEFFGVTHKLLSDLDNTLAAGGKFIQRWEFEKEKKEKIHPKPRYRLSRKKTSFRILIFLHF